MRERSQERDLGLRAVKDPIASSWGEVLKALSPMATEEETIKATNFYRAFGTGRIVLFLGSLLTLVFFLTAIIGGVMHAKQKKTAVRAAAAERRAR